MRRAALAFTAFALLLSGCSESVDGKACPYGTTSGASNTNASTSCKVRPAPKDAERAAVRDGSAWRKGRAAFAASPDAAVGLAGVGVNAWGDTTFTRTDGKGDGRLVTYDRNGRKAAQDVPGTRNYVAVADGLEADLELRDVPAAGLPKVLALVRRAAPGFAFSTASFGKTVTGAQKRWTLMYTREGRDGLVVFAQGDGSGACAFPSQQGDLPRCGAGDLLPTDAGGAVPALPSAPAADPRLACVKAAGTDVAELQKCAG